MDCYRIDELLMKYMDDTLDESEAAKLGQHLSICPNCAMDFNMYDEILTGFSEMELIPAPEGFEERVMCRVAELPSFAAKLNSTVENMMCFIWCGISVLFGMGLLMNINREAIMEYLYAQPELAGYANILAQVGEYSAALAGNLMLTINQIIIRVAEYANASRYVLIAILAVLAAVQITAHVKRRAKVSADAE